MKTATVETSQLSGPALDWAVAQAVGKNPELMDVCCGYGVGAPPECCCDPDVLVEVDHKEWSPTTLWEQGGPLIPMHRVSIIYSDDKCDPCAWTDETAAWGASNPLIAAMRAIVAAQLGDKVEVPAELVEVRDA